MKTKKQNGKNNLESVKKEFGVFIDKKVLGKGK